MAEYTVADLKTKIIDLYGQGKLIPYINVIRWRVGSQSNGTEATIIWKTHRLDFTRTHVWLHGPNGLILDEDASMNAFMNNVEEAMPWPEDTPPAETSTIDDAYAELLELENE